MVITAENQKAKDLKVLQAQLKLHQKLQHLNKSSKNSGKSETSSRHEHTFDESKWESNETNHWHPATCGHDTQKGSSAAHTFVEDTTKSKAATCKEDGVKVEKCSVCNFVKETKLPKGAHNWELVKEVKAEGKTSYKVQKCKTCQLDDICVDALGYTELSGGNKDNSGKTLKLNANGDYAVYKFNLEKTLTGKFGLYGWVDYWKDGSNNNEARGFFSGKNDCPDGNFKMEVNGTALAITNKGTYEEMGLTDGDGSTGSGNSAFGLLEAGAATLAKGDIELKYTRVESYNLNITEIHFLGEYK